MKDIFRLIEDGGKIRLVDQRYGWAISSGSATLTIENGEIIEITPNDDLRVSEEDMGVLFCTPTEEI
jgi:hypothetical protein